MKIPIDDLGKLIAKAFKGSVKTAPARTRYNVLKDANLLGKKFASSDVSGVIRPKVGRIAKTPVRREKRYSSLRGKTLAKTAADQRTAQREANRLLKMNSEPKPPKRVAPSSKTRAVQDVGSTINVPSKATLRKPEYRGPKAGEADQSKIEIAQDRAKYGGPSKNKPKAPKKETKGTKGKPTVSKGSKKVQHRMPRTSSRPQGKTVTPPLTRSQSNIAASKTRTEHINALRSKAQNAKTPKERSDALRELAIFLKKNRAGTR